MRSVGSRREQGASIVELAFVAPVMVLLVFGVTDLARGYQLNIQAENAAREGAAYAQLHANDFECLTVTDVYDRATAEEKKLENHLGFDVSLYGQDDAGEWQLIEGCDSDVAQTGERVRVDVTVTFDVLTPIVENVVGDTIDLTGSAEMRVQR